MLLPGLLMGGLQIIHDADAAEPAALMEGFARTRLVIETATDKCIALDVYLADTPQEHAQGLMFVEKLGPMEGMLFRYPKPAKITMWMKNTYIPLDMLFANRRGIITGIAENTTPLSTTHIPSPDATSRVLEVNAGFAARWGIAPGGHIWIAGD